MYVQTDSYALLLKKKTKGRFIHNSDVTVPCRAGISWQDKFPTADTTFGKVMGHYKNSYGKRKFAAFEGIPYIKPPVGDLRFEEPQNPEPWFGVLDATKTYTCMQNMIFPLNGEEDCVYINVYVPRIQPIFGENLDVVVHIHGGAFVAGSSHLAGPSFLMDKDIVYVNLNYRIGIFGFLSTGDEEVPGNYGLKDQMFALKWVKDNIKYFGGNPNSVTIAGMSAGAVSVHYQYFSPLSKGLFHRGISQSGTALAPWAMVNNPLENAVKLAKSVGCPTSSTKELKECLKSIPAVTLYENVESVYVALGFPLSPFGPVVEKKSATAFITKHPYLLLKQGEVHDIPWITTTTTHEGLMVLGLLNFTTQYVEDNWEQFLPYLLEYHDKIKNSDKPVVAEKIKQFYFNVDDTANLGNLVKAYGDRMFVEPMEKAARMQAKVTKSSVYSYIYGYHHEGEQIFQVPATVRGVGHGADGFLLYDMLFSEIPMGLKELTATDVKMKDFLVEMVVSFANSEVPKLTNVEWTPVTSGESFDHLFIEKPGDIAMRYNREVCPMSFWALLPIYEHYKLDVKEEL
ncbi:hypothetical protein FQA39_LY01820 [Lamprigera yunnana]|nr:hypothetical protein FQA39_LY01820 [Lamprigera yunnana]